MNLERIEELVGLMTGRHTFVRRLGRTSSFGGNDQVAAYANAMSSPMFGWQFVKDFIDADAVLPATVTESELLRAYCWYRYSAKDRDVRSAFELRTQDQRSKQIMLHCMLLSDKYSTEHVATELHLSVDAVKIYETLFWNVRDRLDDALYINGLIYPETTQVLWVDNYHRDESPMSLALRAMKHHGLDTVRQFMGIEGQTLDLDADQYAKTFEAQVLSTAVHSSRMGLLHQKDIPSINTGRTMVQASKIGGQVGKDDDQQLGLGSYGLKGAVLEHFRRISEPDMQYRMLVQATNAAQALRPVETHAE